MNKSLQQTQPQPMEYITSRHKQEAMREAFKLGATDEMLKPAMKPRTGKAIIIWLGIKAWRKGDESFLKSSYMAGRFHVNTQGRD